MNKKTKEKSLLIKSIFFACVAGLLLAFNKKTAKKRIENIGKSFLGQEE